MTKQYYEIHKVEILAKHEQYRRENWKRIKAQRAAHYLKHKQRLLDKMARYYLQFKEPAINLYSNGAAICAWCEQRDIEVLCLDHIANDGHTQRSKIGKGTNIYRWVQQHDYPPGFQVLCLNCNFKKHLQECREKRKV